MRIIVKTKSSLAMVETDVLIPDEELENLKELVSKAQSDYDNGLVNNEDIFQTALDKWNYRAKIIPMADVVIIC